MFYTLIGLHLLRFNYLSAILDPVAMDATMEKVMLNYGLNVCDNDSISVFEGCPINELLELLKTKKHARILRIRITSYTIAYLNLTF